MPAEPSSPGHPLAPPLARKKADAIEGNPFQPMAPPSPTAPSPSPMRAEGAVVAGVTRLEEIPGIDPALPPVLRAGGYGDLWPSQVEAAPLAVAGGNLVLAVPTASGKSLVAYLALLTKAQKGAHGLYLVPLRALASEKYEDLRTLAQPLGLRVGIATGDLDAEDPHLARFDVIVATSEKADALMRHKARWLTDLGCIVADEVHLLGDPSRGPTLEVLLARFRQLNPAAQVVALSATISNSHQIAQWLGATHVKSEWRPVRLREGIFYGKGIQFLDNERYEVHSDQEDASLALAEDAVKGGGSTIVFVSTRKSTEALAERLATAIRCYLPEDSKTVLHDAAEGLKGGPEGTAIESRLAKCMLGGAAFHHAGLRAKERQLVENLFKAGHLRALAATPTLAAGVNLPARRVVVRDLFRYDVNEGNQPIPVLEYKQMAGRAGRPRFDKLGEAITIAKTQDQKSEILLNFLLAQTERVESKLGTETALRTHILSSIASEFVTNEAELDAFMKSTFYAHNADTWVLKERITRVIDFLLEAELVVAADGEFRPTRFGKRVSELYVDPLSAVKLREALANVDKVKRPTPMSFLHAVCATPDMIPIYTRKGDEWLVGVADEREAEFLVPPKHGGDYEFFLAELKTACLLEDWIEERPDEELLKKYGAYPGDVNNKVDTARWLMYATEEIGRIFQKSATRPAAQLQARLAHGARAELLPLLELKGVGRSRARQLWNAGHRTTAALAQATLTELTRVPGIGPTLARSILREVRGAEVAEEEAPATPPADAEKPRDPQRGLSDFGS